MDMYKAIAWQFGLPVERNRAAAYRTIHTKVCRLAVECRLPPCWSSTRPSICACDVLEDLRLLTNYEMDATPRLCLLLMSLSELRRGLAMAVHESLAQRIVVRYHLGGLARDELGAYLDHRGSWPAPACLCSSPAPSRRCTRSPMACRARSTAQAHYALSAAALAKARQIDPEHVHRAVEEVQ
jgi:hypothetical protein